MSSRIRDIRSVEPQPRFYQQTRVIGPPQPLNTLSPVKTGIVGLKTPANVSLGVIPSPHMSDHQIQQNLGGANIHNFNMSATPRQLSAFLPTDNSQMLGDMKGEASIL